MVPIYNEEAALAPFIAAIDAALSDQPVTLELLFVDDGSRDGSWRRLRTMAAADARIRCLRLARNHGKEAALTAGLDHATGDVVIPIDVDLQDPPALIPTLLDHWRDGYDIVNAHRADRSSDGRLKRWSAAAFYWVFNKLSSRVKLTPNVGDFRLMDRRVVDIITQMRERNRFMKGLFAWPGFATATVDYRRQPRTRGNSKWPAWRLVDLALDGIFGFSPVPLRLMLWLGLTITGLAFAYGGGLVIRTLVFGIDLPGYASMMAVILFLGGMQIAAIAVVGEYVGRVLTETQGRPIYIVSESLEPGGTSGDADR